MNDIFDIKTFLFWFIYSFNYLFFIWVFVFFVCFYLILNIFFNSSKINIDTKKIEIDTKKIEDDFIRERFEYLIQNIENLQRNVFYREVSVFLRNIIFRKFWDKSVFFMTLDEIEKNFKNNYNNIFKEVYLLEFDEKKEDNFKVRKEILEKIKI